MRHKFFITTTIAGSLNFFKGNLNFLNTKFEVCAISSNAEKLNEVGKREGIRTHHIPMKRNISLFTDFICLIKFIIFFQKEKPSIVHGNTPKASMLSMVAAWITRVPIRIYMCHGLRFQGYTGFMRNLLISMERISCKCATEVICVSNGTRDTLIKEKICTANKSKVIHYGSASGIDLEYFNPDIVDPLLMRKELNIPTADFVFLFVGRIVKDKGINELVAAFKKLSIQKEDVHLVIVGAYEDINPISNDSKNEIINNKRIHTLGKKSDVRPYMIGANALVLPSYREGFGMVLIEANALGTPAIVSNISGCNEVIIDKVNGEYVNSKDVDSLYDKMKYWVDNRKIVETLASNARRTVVERYDRRTVWEAQYTEYNRLINSKQL